MSAPGVRRLQTTASPGGAGSSRRNGGEKRLCTSGQAPYSDSDAVRARVSRRVLVGAGASRHAIGRSRVRRRAASRARIARRGGHAVAGDLETESVYQRVFLSGQEPVLIAVEPARQPAVVAAIRRVV